MQNLSGIFEGPVWEKLAKTANGRAIGYGEFVGAALFDAQYGYYAKPKTRVGYGGADFYTSASLKEGVFSALVESSAKNMLRSAGENPEEYEFYEIGAEPGSQIVKGSKTARLGEKIRIPARAIAISNELLDARPFERFAFRGGKWRKRVLEISGAGGGKVRARESEADPSEEELAHISKYFFAASVEGFSLDISFDALRLFGEICGAEWRGVLLFADYFRTAAEICELPLGTARAYKSHRAFSDILAEAGERDITHSPCADSLLDTAKKCGFKTFPLMGQERFFMKNAEGEIASIASSPDPFDPKKRELAQLLSPAHMGAAFRILACLR